MAHAQKGRREPMTTRRPRRPSEPVASAFRAAAVQAYGDASHLSPVTGRPAPRRYLVELWQRRHFIWWQSRGRLVTGNDDSRLGSVWLILRPMLDAIFYWLIFGLLLRFDHGMDNFVAFVIVGVFMFQMTSAALTSGTRTIASNLSLTRAFRFPRMALPLADLVYDVLQRLPAIAVMFILVIAIPPHETPEWSWLVFPGVLGLHVILNFGIMLLLARLSTLLPDVSRMVPFVSRLLMYGSGVIFPITRFTDNHPALHAIIQLNPLYVLITMYRQVIIEGVTPPASSWAMLAAYAVCLTIVGGVVFWLGEESYGRDQYR
ncbi:ABC transporter [Micrococcus luteus]|nr:ABC transporter [Micrococcus luteus]